jgi:tetratricopeptide (TPR) repeat protein
LFQSLARQILFLIHMGIAFVISLLILQKVTDAGIQLNKQFSSSVSTQYWLLLLGVSLAMAVISWALQQFAAPFLEKKLARFNGRKLTNFVVPIAAVVLGVVGAILLFADTGIINLLPDNVKTRLANINFAQHSVLERGTFYKDALKVFMDYPLFGAGGGAWAALYEKYQSYPYISRQDHSFFMQYLDEVGIIGTLIFLAFMVYIFYLYIRAYIKRSSELRDSHFIFFIVAISLLIHSLIDFDLSYAFMEILLFLSLGAMASNAGDAPFKWNWDRPVINKSFPALLLILSITVFFISVRLLSANGSYNESLQIINTSKDFNQIITPLDSALKLHPDHPDYLLPTRLFPGKVGILLSVYNQTKDEKYYAEAQTLLNELKIKEPYNRQLLNEQIAAYRVKNQLAEASKLVSENLSNYPWIISVYEESIALNVELGIQANTNKNAQVRDQNWQTALDTYNKVLEGNKALASLPKEQDQGQPFNVTNKIALGISQIKYYQGDYTAAANLLKPFLSNQVDDQVNRSINSSVERWYFAATSKLKTPDQAIYDKLIAKDPNEKQQIEALLNIEAIK